MQPLSNARLPLLARLTSFLALLLACLASPVAAGTKLYATGVGGVGGLSGLYSIDPATGAATLEWYLPGIHVYGGGLAYDATTDTLYATGVLDSDTGTSRLFIIDRFTGAITVFPGMGSLINISQGGLAIHPSTGVLYATGMNGAQGSALFTIDKLTGAPTLVGMNGPGCCVAPYGFLMYGLGFRSDGTLFANGMTLTDPINLSHLYSLDQASGLASDIGAHGVSVGRQLFYSGLAFGASGTMYSLGSLSSSAGGLYSVDPMTGAATAIGATLASMGVDGGLSFAPDGALPTTYCSAKLNSLGCTPTIAFTGSASATAGSGFVVSGSNVRNNKSGLLFYGVNGRAALPFQGGKLCLASPIKRTAALNSAGNPGPANDCSGVYTIDMNTFALSVGPPVPLPALSVAGTQVNCQFWGRDPGFVAPDNTTLTDALEYTVGF